MPLFSLGYKLTQKLGDDYTIILLQITIVLAFRPGGRGIFTNKVKKLFKFP
jgi:hypothetical protein